MDGFFYALLRKEFWQKPTTLTKDRIESVLIALGGTDDRDMAVSVLETAWCFAFPNNSGVSGRIAATQKKPVLRLPQIANVGL